MLFAIVNKKTGTIENTYTDDEVNFSRFGGPWGSPSIVSHVLVPAHVDSRAMTTYQVDDPVAATAKYEGITYTAVTPGQQGNFITLEFDGEKTIEEAVEEWNSENTDNKVSVSEDFYPLVHSAGVLRLRHGKEANDWAIKQKDEELADIRINDLIQAFRVESLNYMETVFLTNNTDQANADHEMWKRMRETPSDYSGLGLKADRQLKDSEGNVIFSPGDPLNTDQLILDWSTRLLDLVAAYSRWRAQRKQRLQDDISQIKG